MTRKWLWEVLLRRREIEYDQLGASIAMAVKGTVSWFVNGQHSQERRSTAKGKDMGSSIAFMLCEFISIPSQSSRDSMAAAGRHGSK